LKFSCTLLTRIKFLLSLESLFLAKDMVLFRMKKVRYWPIYPINVAVASTETRRSICYAKLLTRPLGEPVPVA